ncbi:MAG: hypothetical protein EBT03_13365 [Betaproteobacteria bacterium]|nr:hypothetical protein [Betaproteobacteria bacterium]
MSTSAAGREATQVAVTSPRPPVVRPMPRPSPPAPPPPIAPAPPPPSVETPSLSKEEIRTREIITVVAGAGAGATIGYWAFEHAFGKGMTKRERKDLGKFGIAMAVLAAATQFGLKEWFTVEGLSEKTDELLLGQGK